MEKDMQTMMVIENMKTINRAKETNNFICVNQNFFPRYNSTEPMLPSLARSFSEYGTASGAVNRVKHRGQNDRSAGKWAGTETLTPAETIKPETSAFKQDSEKWSDFEVEAMPFMPDLFRVAMWLTRNRTEAEDLVQETVVQALNAFHGFRLGTNCRAWLTTIMYHLNAKRLKKSGRMRMVDDPEEKLVENIPFEPQLPQNITDDEVLEALRNMPENFRQAVVLSDIEEFSYKEIASILGIPLGTVMSRLFRGRKLLRQVLAGYARKYGYKTAALDS